jgi:hypothetical protein
MNPRVLLTPDDLAIGSAALLKATTSSEGIPVGHELRTAEALELELLLHVVGGAAEVRIQARLRRTEQGKRNDILQQWFVGDTNLIWS